MFIDTVVKGLVVATTLAVLLAGVRSASASAAEVGWPVPTSQATAMEAEFLIDPAAPPAEQTAVCQVDSGVADSAVGEFGAGLLSRFTMQDGDPITDTHDGQHGTWMARYMGAALDGSGMVGIWPGVRIVSVRALVGAGQEFPFATYATAITNCVRLQATGVPIVAVSLSLGGAALPQIEDRDRLRYAVTTANERGVSVFAASGNESGPVLSPAREPGVIGVGAGNAQVDGVHGLGVGRPCFGTAGESPYSSDGRDLIAPGCFLDGGTPDGQVWTGAGSSQATAMVAGLYAAARAYRPSLAGEEVEQALLTSSQAEPDGGWVSARRFFAAVGIDWSALNRPPPVEAHPVGEAEEVSDPAENTTTNPAIGIEPVVGGAVPVRHRLVTPRLTVRRRKGRVLTVTVAKRDMPVGASLYVRALDHRRRTLAKRTGGRRSKVVLTLPYGTRSVDVRYRIGTDTTLDSKAISWKTTVAKPKPRKPSRKGRGGEFR